MKKKGQLFIISAPSGGGKTTLSNMLLKDFPGISYSISYTTRQPRPGEQDGINYHFVSEDKFREMIAANEFFEYAQVHANLYGTARKAVEDMLAAGQDALLDIDVQGAVQLQQQIKYGVYIFIAPPSMIELEKRLAGRGDTASTMGTRIQNALWELDYIPKYDYLLINDNLNDTYKQLSSIYIAEKCRAALLSAPNEVIDMIKGIK